MQNIMDRIEEAIAILDEIQDEYGWIVDGEPNWRVACDARRGNDKIRVGIDGLGEMLSYLTKLGDWRLERLEKGYNDELERLEKGYNDDIGTDEF